MKRTSRLLKPLLFGAMLLETMCVQARYTTNSLPASGMLQQGQFVVTPAIMNNIKKGSVKGDNLYFVENKGQVTDQYLQARADIDFKIAAPGINIFIGNGQIHYQFSRNIGQSNMDAPVANKKGMQVNTYRMDALLVGANMHGKVITEGKQEYYENYLLPQTGDNGATAHAYKKITYKEVYPGIDWVLYIRDSHLEYDFVIHPGGNPAAIKIQYAGATDLKVNKHGGLMATTPMGNVTEQTPFSYQADGKAVATHFVLKNDVLSFATGQYNGTLVIDPALTWATYYGGTAEDYSRALSCDGLGSVYMSGESQSTTNIATTGSFQSTLSGFIDAYVVKFDSTGKRKWATYYGSGGDTYGYSVRYDGFGCVYVAGQTNSPLDLSTNNAFQTRNAGGTCDAYIVKFDSLGTRKWATYYGGTEEDIGRNVTTDAAGNVYLTGQTFSNVLISTVGSFQEVFGGGTFDAFIVKFDSTGVRKWGTYYGGTSDDYGYAASCDKKGNVYMTGYTLSTNAIATPNSHQPVASTGGDFDAFLVKFDSTGARKWGTYYGGVSSELGASVACDGAGNIYMAGRTNSVANISTTNGFQPTIGLSGKGNASTDAYLSKFDSAGVQIWGTYYGGSGADYGWAVSCDGLGHVFLAGETTSPAAIASAGSHQTTLGGGVDAFIAEFDTSGARQWATYHGDVGDDYGFGVSADNFGSIFLAGQTTSDMNIATAGSQQPALGSTVGTGSPDGFLVRYWECPMLQQLTAISGKDTVCAGGSEVYSVPAVNGAFSYTWTLPSGWMGTSTTNTITVTPDINGGAISVSANNSCATVSQSLTVNVYAFLPAHINVNGNVLGTSGTYATYQWYKNDTAIAGANDSTYTVTHNGTYSVTVTNGHGCTDSASYTVTNATGVNNITNISAGIKIYPNPASNVVHIVSTVPVNVTVNSIDGKTMLQQNNATNIDISHLSSGVYILRVTDDQGQLIHVEKLIKTVF